MKECVNVRRDEHNKRKNQHLHFQTKTQSHFQITNYQSTKSSNMASSNSSSGVSSASEESARTKLDRLSENGAVYDALFRQAEQGLREVYNGFRKSIRYWRALQLEEAEAVRRALAQYDQHRTDMCQLRKELEREKAQERGLDTCTARRELALASRDSSVHFGRTNGSDGA